MHSAIAVAYRHLLLQMIGDNFPGLRFRYILALQFVDQVGNVNRLADIDGYLFAKFKNVRRIIGKHFVHA